MASAKPTVRNTFAPTVDGLTWMQNVVSTRRISIRQCSAADAKRYASNNRILTAFVWKSERTYGQMPSQVYLTGTFDNFEKHELTSTGTGTYAAVIEIPPGVYYYRFIIDDQYQVCEDDDNLVEDEETGEYFHELTVSANVDHEANEKAAFNNGIHQNLMDCMDHWGSKLESRKFRSSVVLRLQEQNSSTPSDAAEAKAKVHFPGDNSFKECTKGQKVGRKVGKAGNASNYRQVEANAMERMEMARSLFSQGDFQASVAVYGLVIRLREKYGLKRTSGNVQAHTELAATLFSLGHIKVAEVHLLLAKEIWDNNWVNMYEADQILYPNILNFLGFISDRQKQHDVAEYYYKRAIEMYDRIGHDGPNRQKAVKNLNRCIEVQVKKDMKPGQWAPENARRDRNRRFIKEASVIILEKDNIFRQIENIDPNVENEQPTENGRSESVVCKVRTWKELATAARKSMAMQGNRVTQTAKSIKVSEAEASAVVWQLEAVDAMNEKRYEEALDIITLAKYSRVQHGPWYTIECLCMLRDMAYLYLKLDRPKDAAGHVDLAYELLSMLEKTAKDRKYLKCSPKLLSEDTTFEEMKAGLLMTEGDALKAEKDVDGAKACYRKAIELLDPTSDEDPVVVIGQARAQSHV